MKKILFILIFLNLFLVNIFSQTLSKPKVQNPDISIIGDFAGKVSSDKNDSDINQLLIRSVELSFQGYLYPTVRADSFIALHRHEGELEIELCEGYLSFLKLFDNFNAKLGKIHIDFGRINKLHEHSWQYVDAPLIMSTFLGEHGLVGTGGTLGYLLPVSPLFINLEAGAWKIPAHHHNEEEEHECSEFSIADKVFTSKLWLSFPFGKMDELSISISGLKGSGSHFTHHQDDVIAIDGDIQFKHYFKGTGYIVLQTEYLRFRRQVPIGTLNRNGIYSYFGIKWDKYWNTGLRYDYVESPMPDISQNIHKGSFIITHNLTETFLIRAQYNYIKSEQEIHEGYLQIIWSIGPHTHSIE